MASSDESVVESNNAVVLEPLAVWSAVSKDPISFSLRALFLDLPAFPMATSLCCALHGTLEVNVRVCGLG